MHRIIGHKECQTNTTTGNNRRTKETKTKREETTTYNYQSRN